jgi:hypothetical protein
MIAAAVIFILCPLVVIWGGVKLAREILSYRENRKPAETWQARCARVAFENRCHELGQRHFGKWDQLNQDGDLQ